MSKKILIDAFYPEETKFIVSNEEEKIEEFHYQNSQKMLIKGNIYLGKVNRIEPSLQAAFVDYGKDKKGFLSFPMIYPKYYHIPASDKEQLVNKIKKPHELNKDSTEDFLLNECKTKKNTFNNELYNSYKIQEVIKKDQIILVQIEKEERGSKGAFLTTYVTLSGRYCVFSPNSLKSSLGISKKLDDTQERERLKAISLEILEDYSSSNLILRTASAYKTKSEIQKDFQYLIRTWEKIKKLAISSYAPSLVYEAGDMVINGIKEHYTNDVSKIIVSGDNTYKKVLEFLKIFIPKNIQKLQKYSDIVPIFHQYNVEKHLYKLYSNVVQLKSGGYLVINSTEALVSIDVNSGTYTDERNVENTAFNTNLEAAMEIAKQVKFRGLSGLIVIDFIDMIELQNKRQVEKELKKVFWYDKVKVQIGRISEFGLLEMSRQRIGRSFIESNSKLCSSCAGKGRVIMHSSIATLLISKLKYMLHRKKTKFATIIATTDIVTYIINHFKNELYLLENSYHAKINLIIDDIISPESYKITFHKTCNIDGKKNRSYHISENFAARLKNNFRSQNHNATDDDASSLGSLDHRMSADSLIKRNNHLRHDKELVNNKKSKDKKGKNQYNSKKKKVIFFKKIWSKITS